MLHRILVGYDDSDQARDAMALARVIGDATQARIVVAGILPQDPLTGGRDVLFKDSDAELKRAVERAAAPAGAEPLTAPSSSPARGLHQLAEELNADLIVVGSSHRGRTGRAVAGTTAQRLLHGASCAVAIAPRGYHEADHHLGVLAVGYNGLSESVEALAAATALAQQAGATLRLLTAADAQALGGPPVTGYPSAEFREALRVHCQRELDEALESIPSELRPSGELMHGEAATALAAEAAQGVDLLFVGSRGYGPLRRVLLGSVSYALAKAAPCPLMVVPRGAYEEPPTGSPTLVATRTKHGVSEE